MTINTFYFTTTYSSGPGPYLLKRVKDAVSNLNLQKLQFDQFSAGLPEESIQIWKEMVEKWEQDPINHPNPFAASAPCKLSFVSLEKTFFISILAVTLAQVRRELAEEEASQNGASDSATDGHISMSAGVLIMAGLDLEDQQ